jgi:hypothetical protein
MFLEVKRTKERMGGVEICPQCRELERAFHILLKCPETKR